MAEAFIKGMVISKGEMEMVSGQREENFGERGQTLSGTAINARERQGDNATFHFIDGLANAIRQVANIVLDLAPKIYDTEQIRHILAEDGTRIMMKIDPTAKQAYSEEKAGEEGAMNAIFNPNVGRYWVDTDVGPSYATRRQEAWNAYAQIIATNKELVGVAGDLLFMNGDFPGADEMAERLRKLIEMTHPGLVGEGPAPALVAAQNQLASLKQLIAEMTEKLAANELELKDKTRRTEIESYRAESDRLKQIDNAKESIPEDLKSMVDKSIRDILADRDTTKSDGADTDDEGGSDAPPAGGAQQGVDGQWYIPDPMNPGRHLRLEQGG